MGSAPSNGAVADCDKALNKVVDICEGLLSPQNKRESFLLSEARRISKTVAENERKHESVDITNASSAVVSSFSTSRAWNREFQELIEQPIQSIADQRDRLAEIEKFLELFANEFIPSAELAISERHLAWEHRTYTKGHVAAEQPKKKSVVFRDVLKLPDSCNCPPIEMGKYASSTITITVYDNEIEAKKATTSLRNAALLLGTCTTGISVPLQAQVTVAGFCVIVSAEAPIPDTDPPVYSCVTYGRKRVHQTTAEPALNLRRSLEIFNLKPTPLTGSLEPLCGCPDLAIFVGTDGRNYVKGLADLLPSYPPPVGSDVHPDSVVSLRPELLHTCRPLSSCSFRMQGLPEHRQNDDDTREAVRYMLKELCPLAETIISNLSLESELEICNQVIPVCHQHGIPAACLGYLYDIHHNKHILIAAVGKACKAALFERLRKCDVSNTSTTSSSVSSFLLSIIESANSKFTDSFWCDVIIMKLYQKQVYFPALDAEHTTRYLDVNLLIRFIVADCLVKLEEPIPPSADLMTDYQLLEAVNEVQTCSKKLKLLPVGEYSLFARALRSEGNEEAERRLKERITKLSSTNPQHPHIIHAKQLLVKTILFQSDAIVKSKVKECSVLLKECIAQRAGAAKTESDNLLRCHDLRLLSMFFYKLKGWELAEEYIKQALRIGHQDPRLHAQLLLDAGTVLKHQQNRVEDAIASLNQSLTMHKQIYGDSNLKIIPCYTALAALYEDQGQADNAEPLRAMVLQLRVRALGRLHSGVSTALNNLAVNLYEQQRFDEAEPLYHKDLEICQTLLGTDHEDVATSMNNLASIYDSRGAYDKSVPLYISDLEITTRHLGREHPKTAISLNNLASSYTAQGKLDEALAMYEECLAIRESVYGDSHLLVAETLNNLGTLLEKQGHPSKAKTSYLKAMSIMEATRSDVQRLTSLMTNIQSVCETLEEFEESEKWGERLLELKRQDASLHNAITEYEESKRGSFGTNKQLSQSTISMR
eukprot:TRINITY_DN14044_c0_g1_i1.p1 TRINITY_DN14044_c0_g1~~TRINITY_DN14044_c0_g1_i1.p1  ORF type:complete len:1013 (+),score=190.09 TRINITY_DN14044_c0_g1_i1:61-3039(+)